MSRIRVGGYTEHPEPFLGPVITPETACRLLEAQRALTARGGVPLVEMKPAEGREALLSPGLLDVTAIPGREDEELFGPLLQVVRVRHFNEALEEVNRTAYGLAAGILTDDRALYRLFSNFVRAGVIHWNRPTTGASGRLPFGGLGRSGNHRPGGYRTTEHCSDLVACLKGGALSSDGVLPLGIG
jgi:succinylglutamic semialdehyde dehydrogenase